MNMEADAPIGFDETPPEKAVPETAGADWESRLLEREMTPANTGLAFPESGRRDKTPGGSHEKIP